MKQTLLPNVADPKLPPVDFTFLGTPDLIPHLDRPECKGLLATLMHKANVRCPLTVIAQQPVKGTAHSKGLQLHHYRGDGLLLRWHAPDASNDRNIQFLVRTPTAVISTAEVFHERVSKAFEELYARQSKPRHKSSMEEEKNGANNADPELSERLADVDIELLFVALHDGSHILKSGLVSRKRIRNALVHTLGYSNDQANTYMAQMLDAGDLVNSDEMDFYGVGDRWKKYIPTDSPRGGSIEEAGSQTKGGTIETTSEPAGEPRSRSSSELITAGAARLFAGKDSAPPQAPAMSAASAQQVPASRTAAEPVKKVDARVRLAQLMRSADEAARKRKRLAEIDEEFGNVARTFELYKRRMDELKEERSQIIAELDSPKLKDAEARLKLIQEQLGD